MVSAIEKAERFRQLHVPGDPVVLINVWDVASARVVASRPGTKALATASWSVSAALGYEDGGAMPVGEALAQAARIVSATELPVSVDFEKGYADSLEQLAHNTELLIAIGAVGLNIEDSIGDDDGECWPVEVAAARVAAVRDAARRRGIPLVINARTDVLAGGGTVEEAIARGRAYLEAGADCVFVLGAIGPHLRDIVEGMPGPVSVLAGAGSPSVAELAAAGVARISVGPGSMGVAYSALGNLVDLVGEGGAWPVDMRYRPGRT